MTKNFPLRLLLVRHGRTAWNVERRVLGRTDLPLDEVGLEQAAALPARIGAVDRVWSSPLLRARQTAQVLGEPALEPGLQEMDQGELEGLYGEEMAARHGELLRRWREDPTGVRLPGGEAMEEVQARAIAALYRIADESPPGATVAVVTHQIVLGTICCALAGEGLVAWTRYSHHNCGWSEVVVDGAGLHLVASCQR